MRDTAPSVIQFCAAALRRLGRCIFLGIVYACLLVILTWASLAIYFLSLPWAWAGTILAYAFASFSAWAILFSRRPKMRWALAGLLLLVIAWYASIQPSHDREWRPEVALMPRAMIDGDRVRITGVRHFDFRTRDDFTIRYEEREVLLSHLTSVDFYISYWAEGPVGHTFLSFNFDNADPVCISIETRPEVGEGFAPIASMFKQFELIYVVGDERDLVRLRTNFRDEEVFLYRIRTTRERAHDLFRVYLDRINSLADQPEFYHLLSNSCTINIVRYANAVGRTGGFNFRHLLNGFIDYYLFRSGLIETNLPFEELRLRSRITEVARAAPNDPDFSKTIRKSLP